MQLKFKGYDTKKNIMYSAEELGADELTISPDGRGFVNVNGISQKLSQYAPHITPLQFTNQCDMHGAELYNGDIIKRGPDFWTITQEETGAWMAQCKTRMGTKEYYVETIADASELVGSKYETPELIKQ